MWTGYMENGYHIVTGEKPSQTWTRCRGTYTHPTHCVFNVPLKCSRAKLKRKRNFRNFQVFMRLLARCSQVQKTYQNLHFVLCKRKKIALNCWNFLFSRSTFWESACAWDFGKKLWGIEIPMEITKSYSGRVLSYGGRFWSWNDVLSCLHRPVQSSHCRWERWNFCHLNTKNRLKFFFVFRADYVLSLRGAAIRNFLFLGHEMETHNEVLARQGKTFSQQPLHNDSHIDEDSTHRFRVFCPISHWTSDVYCYGS